MLLDFSFSLLSTTSNKKIARVFAWNLLGNFKQIASYTVPENYWIYSKAQLIV